MLCRETEYLFIFSGTLPVMEFKTAKNKELLHKCPFSKKDTTLEWLIPGNSKCAKIRRGFRNLFLISEKNGRRCFNQMSTTGYIFERERHLTNHYYMIHPYSNFRLYWEMLVLIEIYYCLILHNMLKAVFYSEKSCLNYPVISRLLMDLFETTDIILRFFTGFVNKASQTVTLNPRKVFWHNLKSPYFLLDLLGAFPFQILFFVLIPKCPNALFYYVSVIKIFRMRIFCIYVKHLAKIFQWTDRHHLRVTIYTWTIVGSFCLTAIYFKMLTFDSTKETWMKEFDFKSEGERYFMIFYSVVSILMLQNGLLGTANITETSDLMFYCALLILVYIWSAVGVGFFVFMHGLTKTSRMKYDEMIQAVRKYMIHKDLPKDLQKKILAYYEFRFERVFFREREIMQTISEPLRHEISYFCNSHFFLDKESVFAKLPKDIIELLCVALKSKIYVTNDIIATAGEEANQMFIVGCGTVGTYSPLGQEVDHLHEGSQFGLIMLMRPENQYLLTYIALESCEIFTMTYEEFIVALGNDQQHLDSVIRAVVKKRNTTMKYLKRERNIFDYDSSSERQPRRS